MPPQSAQYIRPVRGWASPSVRVSPDIATDTLHVIKGYLKSPEDKNQWIVDEEAAAIVRRIFAMTMAGYGPYQISKRLAAGKVEIPAVHMARHGAGLNKNET